jgi:hypothetical protein
MRCMLRYDNHLPPLPFCSQVHVPEGLTGLDLDVIKLTAQFVARNGAAFLTGLTTREANNPQVGVASSQNNSQPRGTFP